MRPARYFFVIQLSNSRAFPGRLDEIRKRLSQSVDLKLLEHCPFILLKPGNRVRSIADEILTDVQIDPNIVLETENIETALALSRHGMGITFYPKMFMKEEIPTAAQKELFIKKYHLNLYSLNYDRAHGVLGIGYHKSHYISRATKEFIRIAKEKIHYNE